MCIDVHLVRDPCKPGKPDASADGDPGRLCVAAIAAAQACITLLLRCLDPPMGCEVHLGCGHHATRGRAPAAHGQLQLPSPPEVGRHRPLGAVSTRRSIGHRIGRGLQGVLGERQRAHQFPALPGMIRRAHLRLPPGGPVSPFRPATLFLGAGVSSMVGGKRSLRRRQAGR